MGLSASYEEQSLLVAAQNPLSRAGLAALLEERGCVVLARVGWQSLPAAIQRHEPDVLLLDLAGSGDRARASLLQIDARTGLLALADSDEPLASLLPLLQAFPQFALLARDSQPAAILAALEALAAGLCLISPAFAVRLHAAQPSVAAPRPSPLTAREAEVLQRLSLGLTNRAIALDLGITQHTVKYHVNAIMGKLEAQSRTEAVVRAAQLGLLTF